MHVCNKARIPRHRHRLARHAYILTSDARFPREDRREDVGVGVVECGLYVRTRSSVKTIDRFAYVLCFLLTSSSI